MNWLWLVGLLAAVPPAQDRELGQLANRVRIAFESREFSRLFEDLRPIHLELPNQLAAVSVRGEIAAAALASLVRRTADLELVTVGAAVVAPGHGYIEIRRRFVALGTQQEQHQKILISARLDGTSWRVTEVWITAAKP